MSLRRVYETTFIVNAALEDTDIESVVSKVTNYIENHGAEILEVNKWGRRRLAYPINKKYNGFYVHVVYNVSPSAIPIFERFLVLEDTILRHLTLILPQKLRDFRAGRALQAGTTNAPTEVGPKNQHKGRTQHSQHSHAPQAAPVEAPAEAEAETETETVTETAE